MGLLSILVWIVVLQFLLFIIIDHEIRCGDQNIIYTCSLAKENKISGSLCFQLCSDQYFANAGRKCLEGNPRKQVLMFFDWPDLGSIVVKFNSYWYGDFWAASTEAVPLRDYAKKLCLRETENADFCDSYLASVTSLADSNSDGRVDDVEAVTMATLLRNREFFMLSLLHKSGFTSDVVGFCGGVYAVESVDFSVDDVYGTTDHLLDTLQLPISDLFISAIPEHILHVADPLARNYFVNFKQKLSPSVQDMVWLTDQAFKLLRDLADYRGVRLHMCDIHLGNFGVIVRRREGGAQKRLVLIDFDTLFPAAAANRELQSKSCDDDGDCCIGEFTDCMSSCNPDSGTCGGELITQNLNTLCRTLLGVVWRWAFTKEDGRAVEFPYSDVFRLLEDCTSLPKYDDETSHSQNQIKLVSDKFQQITGYYD